MIYICIASTELQIRLWCERLTHRGSQETMGKSSRWCSQGYKECYVIILRIPFKSVLTGGYKLQEPDGTTRLVEYTADAHNGFNAIVKKIGHAHHHEVHGKNQGGDWSGNDNSWNNGGHWNNGYGNGGGHHGAYSYSYLKQYSH